MIKPLRWIQSRSRDRDGSALGGTVSHNQPPRDPRMPTSPSGRVPQWVKDQAEGRPVDVVPFRAAPSTTTSAGRRKRSRTFLKIAVGATVVTGLVLATGGLKSPGGPGLPGTSPIIAAGSANAPKPGNEEASHRLLPASPVPFGGEGRSVHFLGHQRASAKPVSWSPCRPIHYVVRPDNAPAGGAELIDASVRLVSAATGLSFVNDGPTREGPTADREYYQPQRYGKRWAPVLITWATADEVPDFGIDIVGEAEAAGALTPSGDKTYVTGTLALDASRLTQMIQRGQARTATAVVLHELGHLVGLAHVNDPTQVMYPRAAVAVTTYGQGDLAGLAELGRGACQKDI